MNFVFGQVLAFEALASNAIALDGAVQGPAVDAAARRFSFDHHAGCVRLVTLATCQQVAVAIRLGLVVDDKTEVVINDLDADTVLAVWLLQNPERVGEPRVVELVERIGLTDAHGPIFAPHPLHRELAPAWGSKDPQTLEMLAGFLAKVSAYADGAWQAPPARPERKSDGFGWNPKAGWYAITGVTGFDQAYEGGALVAVLYTDAPNGTKMYTVGKRSDLVPFPVGPGSKVRPATSATDFLNDTLLGRLALAELEVNPEQSLAGNWGGATTVGGSPRNPDGSQSRLTPEQILKICTGMTGCPTCKGRGYTGQVTGMGSADFCPDCGGK
ncbi:MAG: hypothetical protein WC802_01550 [Patescibacteria group bacterium]